MAPRPKMENARDQQYRLRMTREEMRKLEFCCDKLGMQKSEVIRAGIDKMYNKALKV